MPRRELKNPSQVEAWLVAWGARMQAPGEMILIGSGALLWHAAQRGIETPLPENSMDVDPITSSEEIAALGYEAHIGSEFERQNGWHVNLMPPDVLSHFPAGWRERAVRKEYGSLTVTVPAVSDLLVPKLERGERRDVAHAEWSRRVGLC